MKSFWILCFCMLATNLAVGQSDLLQAVEQEQRAKVLYQVRKGVDLNAQVLPEKYTPLTYAIKQGSSTAFIQWLLEQEVDPDKSNNGKTPIMYAIKYNRIDLIPVLIESGADIDERNSQKQSALIYACKNNHVEAASQLLAMKANPELLDYKNRSAAFFAEQSGDKALMKLFGIADTYQLQQDGPYVFYNGDNQLLIQETKVKGDTYDLQQTYKDLSANGSTLFRCASDQGLVSHQFTVHYNKQGPPKSVLLDSLPDEVYVFPDINGNFHALRTFLLDNKLIDINLNWIAQDAHVVLLGDVFAYGDNVLPCLWLIYELSQQASAAKGGVHLVLGNRDLEVLNGKASQLHKKYKGLAQYTNQDFESMFSTNSVLGDWLRQQPLVLKMGKTLFVHAGLEPFISSENLTVDQINTITKKGLNQESLTEKESSIYNLLVSENGPSNSKRMAEEELEDKEVEQILQTLGVDLIIQSQKQVDRSQYILEKKVLLINTPQPSNSKEGRATGILIKKGYPYILKDKKKVIEI